MFFWNSLVHTDRCNHPISSETCFGWKGNYIIPSTHPYRATVLVFYSVILIHSPASSNMSASTKLWLILPLALGVFDTIAEAGKCVTLRNTVNYVRFILSIVIFESLILFLFSLCRMWHGYLAPDQKCKPNWWITWDIGMILYSSSLANIVIVCGKVL